MEFEKFNRLCLIILIGIIILQFILMIVNIDFIVGIINLELSDFLCILFWIILAFNIGAIVDNDYLNK